MKTLQNNFTTPEQSKRLLELGVPADCADMLWDGTYDLVNGWEFEDYPTFSDKHYSYYQGLYREEDAVHILPCWSVGRLIEIIGICAGMECVDFETLAWTQGVWSEKLIRMIGYLVKYNKIDFSELEE